MSKVKRSQRTNLRGKQSTRLRHGNRQRRWWLAGVTAFVLLLAGAFIFWSQPKPETLSPARMAEDPALGPADAPVTIVEYGDFGCTTCRAWFKAGILEQIRSKYGDNIRFVWRDFPIITAESPKAAEAGQCALDQGKFWEYHDLLYNKAPALSVGDLKAYAAQLGMDGAKFNQCLDSGRYKTKVDQSMQDAFQRGFRGTPSFLINGKPLAGPPSLAELESLIDPILNSRG